MNCIIKIPLLCPNISVGGNDISFITSVNVFKVFSNKPSFCQNCLEAVVARNLLEKPIVNIEERGDTCLLGYMTDGLECSGCFSFLPFL